MRRLSPESLLILDQPVRLGAAPARAAAHGQAETADGKEKKLQAAFDEARDRGFEEGMKDASREIDRRVEKIAQRLQREHADEVGRLQGRADALRKVTEGMAGAMKRFDKDAGEISVEVAYAALVRLLGTSLGKRDLLQEHCRAVIREFGDPPATLKVSEQDLALLDVGAFPLPVESDHRLVSGECVIDAAKGQFDCGLEVRLEAIKQAFLAGLREDRGDRS